MIKPYYQDNHITIYNGHVLDVLHEMESESVQCVVTSPPYLGLRDYGIEPQIWDEKHYLDENGERKVNCEHEWGEALMAKQSGGGLALGGNQTGGDKEFQLGERAQGSFCLHCNAWRGSLGLEPTPELYVKHIVDIFREVRRVLRKDGTLWLNLGDSYAGSWSSNSMRPGGGEQRPGHPGFQQLDERYTGRNGNVPAGLKPKDLVGIPWRVAFALQADGWYLRSDIIWSKPNPMPESVKDRPTKSHEYIFLLTKSAKYFWDQDAVREPHKEVSLARAHRNRFGGKYQSTDRREHGSLKKGVNFGPDGNADLICSPGGRNIRSVWDIATEPTPEAHFATFPQKLVEPCIKAGTSEKGCCPECGSPWVRVIDYKANYEKRESAHAPNNSPTKVDSLGWKEPKRGTLGWNPSCKCYSLEDRHIGGRTYDKLMHPIPCTVLDPFGGSGKTGIVAKALGRKAILIELNPEYCEMPLKKVAQEVIPLTF